MGTTYVSIETHGTELVARNLELVGARGANMRGAWPFVIRRMEKAMEQSFKTRGMSENNYWPDLSPRYQREKLTKGLNPNILRATDDMYEALTGRDHTNATHHSPGGQDDDYLYFGASDLPQFRFQQGNNSKKRAFERKKTGAPNTGEFPIRKPVVFRISTRNEISQLMLEWTLGQRNRAGRKIDPTTFRFVKST